jgi:uncharacterized protein YegJ (DUF2314 family)
MIFRFLILVLTLTSITTTNMAESLENNKVHKPDVFIHYVIFFDNDNQVTLSEDFMNQCNLNGVESLSGFEDYVGSPSIIVSELNMEQLPIPSLERLQYFGRGFDQARADRLMSSKHSISIMGIGPFDSSHVLLKKITICVDDIARKYDAFVHDVADSLTFTSQSFTKSRASEIIQGRLSSSQFGIRAYRVENGIRSVSMGLEKFGQPNLTIENFSEHHMEYIDKLFGMVLQHVIESNNKVIPGSISLNVSDISNTTFKKRILSSILENGKGKAKLELKKAHPLEGDPLDLLAISFKNPPGEALWNEQANLLRLVFGKDRDISSVPGSVMLDNEIIKAKAQVKDILDKGLTLEKGGSRLLIATVLEETNEVIWVEVTEWQGLKGMGILLSNPNNVDGLSSGMKYEFNFDSIMDFKLYGSDGKILEQGGVDELVRKIGSM